MPFVLANARLGVTTTLKLADDLSPALSLTAIVTVPVPVATPKGINVRLYAFVLPLLFAGSAATLTLGISPGLSSELAFTVRVLPCGEKIFNGSGPSCVAAATGRSAGTEGNSGGCAAKATPIIKVFCA